jgi:hypothetical protein
MRWLRVLFINIAVLCVLLVAVELVFGSWFGSAQYGKLNLPRDVHLQFDVSSLYQRTTPVIYTRDKHGLRGNDGETWSDALRATLAARGASLSVVNGGVDGQSTVGHLYNFEAWFPNIPNLKARYMLVYAGVNDMALTGAPNPFDAMVETDAARQFKRYIANHSALWRAGEIVKGMWQAQKARVVHGGAAAHGAPWVAFAGDFPPIEEALAADLSAYAARLTELAKRIRAHGAVPIFMTQPAGYYRLVDGELYGQPQPDGSVNVGAYFRLMAFNDQLLATCRALNEVCFDVAREVEFADGDFYDAVHTTPAGSAKIGAYVAEKILTPLQSR